MNRLVADASEALCGGLTDLGCIYEIEFDNRGGNRSRYIFVRKPIAAKIRVSDHPSDRTAKEVVRSRTLTLDVAVKRAGLSWQDALSEIGNAISAKAATGA